MVLPPLTATDMGYQSLNKEVCFYSKRSEKPRGILSRGVFSFLISLTMIADGSDIPSQQLIVCGAPPDHGAWLLWTLTFHFAFHPLATEYHLGLLKAKLAKYRAQLLEPSKSASSKGEGFDVMKSGDARVALIGFPSVGKVSDDQCGLWAERQDVSIQT